MVDNFFQEKQVDLDESLQEVILNRLVRCNHKASSKYQRLLIRRKAKKQEETPQPQKKTLQDKETRTKYYEELKLKSEESQQAAKMYWKAQKEREQKLQKQFQGIQSKIQRNEDRQKQEQELAKENARKAYHQSLEKMQKKNEKRKQEMEELKVRSKNYEFLSTKPLYKSLEERFHTEVELPTLEKRKAELAKMRAFNDPIRHENIKKHIQWYEEMKQKRNSKMEHSASFSHLSTSLGYKIYMEEKKNLEKNDSLVKLKTELIGKRKNYSDVVKNEHKPNLDKIKQEEIRSRLEKFSKSKMTLLQIKELEGKSGNLVKSRSAWKPRKYPKNPLVPEPLPKREGKQVDYLAEWKKNREDAKNTDPISLLSQVNHAPPEEKLDKLKKITERIDSEVRKQDIRIEATKGSAVNFKQREDIDNMLVTSIKTKLDVLQGIDSN